MRRILFVAAAAFALAAIVASALGLRSAHADVPASAQGAPATFRGTANGRDTSHSIELQPGLVVVHARHAGQQNFILALTLPKPGVDIEREYDESINLINEIGQYNGGAAGRVPKAGTYVLQLRASGSYEITVEQPPLAEVAAPGQREFSGTGQQVTPMVELPAGAHRITFTHDGAAPRGLAQLWLYDMAGNTVSGDLYGRLVNEIGPYDGAVELEIILEGPHLFHVKASGSWTLRVD